MCVLFAGSAVSYAARGPSSAILRRTGTETLVDRLPGPEPALPAHAARGASSGQGTARFSIHTRSSDAEALLERVVCPVGSNGRHVLGAQPQDV